MRRWMSRVATEQISARLGTDEECRLLHEPTSAVLLTRRRTTHDDTGRPIDFGDHAFRSSRYTYDLTLVSARTNHNGQRRARAAANPTRRSRTQMKGAAP